MALTGTKKQKIIDKIRLLFNLADSVVKGGKDSEENHEAQLALETARKMLLSYGLEEEDVRLKDDAATFKNSGGFVVNAKGLSQGKWVKSLAITVADYFCVRVVATKMRPEDRLNSYLFFGMEVGSQLAAMAFRSCHDQIRVLSRKYKVEHQDWIKSHLKFMFKTFDQYRNTSKEEYRNGMVNGFSWKLREIKLKESSETQALALSYEEVAEDFLKQNHVNVKSPKPKMKTKMKKVTGDGHYYEGVKDAERVQLTPLLHE